MAPRSAQCSFYLGQAYLAIADFEQAIATHLRTVALDADHVRAHQQLAKAYRETGQAERARHHQEIADGGKPR